MKRGGVFRRGAFNGTTGGVLAVAVALAVAGGVLASRLPVKSDLSYLLPDATPSVRQLRALEKRARVATTFMIGIESDDSRARTRATALMLRRIAALDAKALGIAKVTANDAAVRRFVSDNRFLFADLSDLATARDAIRQLALKANPLYVSLDTEDAAHARRVDPFDTIRHKLDRAEAEAAHPKPLVSADGRLQLILVTASFDGGDLDRGAALDGALERQLRDTARDVGPAVQMGMAGDVVRGLAEQRGLITGMLIATALTIAVVLAALLIFFRSSGAVLALSWSLAVGALATFGFTRLAIGQLNIASAFLSSIVIGNGINFGIILLGRYLEERRAGEAVDVALRAAVRGTARSTAAAALAAGTAYVSLAVTPFRGFRDFGIIGGVGMALCWLCAYTVLPASLRVLESRRWINVGPEPAMVGWFARLLPARSRPVAVASLGLFGLAAVGAWRYLAHDPIETNLHNVSSTGPELDRASAWMDKFDHAFGYGIASGFVLGANTHDQATALARRLRAVDEGKAEPDRLFNHVTTLDDQLPTAQAEKLSLLAELRRSIDRRLGESSTLDDAERTALERLRPPDGLHVLTDADVPAEIAWPYLERDGTRGRIVLANNATAIDSWNTRDLRRFASAVRALDLGPHVLVGGTAFVLTDILDAMEQDGPWAVGAAGLGAMIVVLMLLGAGRAAAVTLFCAAFGSAALLALASLIGLKVTFLNFVALPITIGIGVDYAVNALGRDIAEAHRPPDAEGHARTMSAVALCSFTTVVGYASLLFSANRGIRTFGLSAILGEATCLGAALLVAPALMRALGGQPRFRAVGAIDGARLAMRPARTDASRTLATDGSAPSTVATTELR
jgi:uncharacterized protein